MMAALRRLASLIFGLVIALLAWPRAHAANLEHLDLVSLAFESDAIVLARSVGERRYEVVQTYAGALAPGDAFEVRPHSHRLEVAWPKPNDEWAPDDEVVVFLTRDERSGWWIIPSGLRIFVDGLTYRFEQSKSPGPLYAVVQGHDPYDVLGDPRGGAGLDRAEFEVELAAAIVVATRLHAAIAAIDDPARRVELLDYLGPPPDEEDDEPASIPARKGGFEDAASDAILAALWANDDLESSLEGLSRLRFMDHRSWRGSPIRVEPKRLVEYAGDRTKPVSRRVAAIRLLATATQLAGSPTPATVSELLADPDPRVRAATAALTYVGSDWRAKIAARLPVESDPGAKLQLFETALRLEISEASWPADTWPLVAAQRRARVVEVRWADLRTSPWELHEIVATARLPDGELREWVIWPSPIALFWVWVDIRGGDSVTRPIGSTSFHTWLLPDPPLPEQGRIELELAVRFTRGDETLERRVGLPALRPSQGEPPRASVEPLAEPPGCACSSEGGTSGLAWVWVSWVAMAWHRRRRAV